MSPEAPAWPLRRLTSDLYASLLPREGRLAPTPQPQVAFGFLPPPVGEPLQAGPVTISLVRTQPAGHGAPLNLTAIAVSEEARPDARMRLTVIRDGSQIYTAEQRADVRRGSTVFPFYLPQSALDPGYYELSFDLTDGEGRRMGHTKTYLHKVTEGRVRSQVEQARERLAELDRLLSEAEAKGLAERLSKSPPALKRGGKKWAWWAM